MINGYFKKAENTLISLKNEKDNCEWEISKSYYSMYFSIYAIFMKIGIKCEIHSCTIAILKKYFYEKFTNDEIKIFEEAQKLRKKVQYYIIEEIEILNYKEIVNKSLEFHLKCKDVVKNLKKEEIDKIRYFLK